MRDELDKGRVHEDAAADGIEHTVDNPAGGGLQRKRLGRYEAHANGEGRADGVEHPEQVGRPPPGAGRPGGHAEARAQSKPLEGLVEDQDNEEDDEIVGDGESQADENGVENDAELEDEDGRHLGGVIGVLVTLDVIVSMSEVVLSTRRVADVVARDGDFAFVEETRPRSAGMLLGGRRAHSGLV